MAFSFFGALLATLISSLLGALASLGLGLVFGETLPGTAAGPDGGVFLGGAFLLGLFAHTSGNFFMRLANLAARNLGVNVVVYLTPLLALGWLALFWEIRVAAVWMLLAGVAVVAAANLLLALGSGRGRAGRRAREQTARPEPG